MFLGVEIGGTKLQAALGAGDGTLSHILRDTVIPENGAAGILRKVQGMILELKFLAREPVQAVGIGFGGPVDLRTQTVIKSHQIAGWEQFPLGAWAEQIAGCPVVVGNDADVAGLGEVIFGAGQRLSPVFYVTLGTGVGGSLILNGSIYSGAGRGAAEIGHTIVAPRGELPDILEHFAAGPAIARRGGFATGQLVKAAAERGDAQARKSIALAVEALAQALRQVIVLLCPKRIILGGGVSFFGETLLFQPLRETLLGTFPPFEGLTDLVPAALGEDGVPHGAIALARKQLFSS